MITNMPGVFAWSCDCTICLVVDINVEFIMDVDSTEAIGKPCEQCGGIIRVMHSPHGPSLITTEEHGFVPGATAMRGHPYDPDRCPREITEAQKLRNAPNN